MRKQEIQGSTEEKKELAGLPCSVKKTCDKREEVSRESTLLRSKTTSQGSMWASQLGGHVNLGSAVK